METAYFLEMMVRYLPSYVASDPISLILVFYTV
jgi:hypothetical protein